MSFQQIFAVLSVADKPAAVAWYARLFGRPADREPMPSLSEWDVGGSALQLYEDAERAGKGFLTLTVADLDAARTELQAHGLTLGEARPGGGTRLASIDDPEGNRITLIEG